MRVLLAVPVSEQRFNMIPDLGLGYLSAITRGAGHDVRVLDCVREGYSLDQFESALGEWKPDVLGLKVYSCDIESARAMVSRARRACPDAVTVIGGPHPSCETPVGLAAQFPRLQFALAGEAEPGWAAFLRHCENGDGDLSSIPGLIWSLSGLELGQAAASDLCANDKGLVGDLDTLPLPAWDLIPPGKYRSGYSFMTARLPAAPLLVTRGCPFSCTFCSSHLISGRRVRKRSVSRVLEEIRLLRDQFGVRTIDIVDENLAFDRKHVIELCEQMIRERLGVAWNCPYGVRLTSLDEELLVLMERAGCFALSVGIESGSPRVLKAIKKQLTVDEVISKVRLIKRVTGMTLQGYFMMGFPGETAEDIEATIRLACSLPFDMVTFCPLRVTPGTEVYRRLQEEGKLGPVMDYDGLGHHYFVRSFSAVSDREMSRLYRSAIARFYFRPKVVLNLLLRIRSWAHVKTILVGLMRLVVSRGRSRP